MFQIFKIMRVVIKEKCYCPWVVTEGVSKKRNLKRSRLRNFKAGVVNEICLDATRNYAAAEDQRDFLSPIFDANNGATSAYAVSRCIRYHLLSRVKFYPPFLIMLLVTQFFLYSFYKLTRLRYIEPFELGVRSIVKLNVQKSRLSRWRTSWRL